MTLRINGSTSGYTEIAAPAVAGNNTITLPSDNGATNQLLKNGTTAGSLSWSSMVENPSGHVGIGRSPSQALDVNGVVRIFNVSGSALEIGAGTATNQVALIDLTGDTDRKSVV